MNNINTNLYPQYNFNFGGIKDTYDKYYLDRDNGGNLIVVDKSTNVIFNDPLLIDRIKFCISWVNSVGLAMGLTKEDTKMRYHYSFSEEARLSYAQIMTVISKQLKTTGDIDINDIIYNLEHEYNNLFGLELARRLFNEKKYLIALDKWARHAIPDALEPTQPLVTLDELCSDSQNSKKM